MNRRRRQLPSCLPGVSVRLRPAPGGIRDRAGQCAGKGRKEGVGAPEPRYRGCPAAIGRTRSRLFGPNLPRPACFPFTIGWANQIGFPLKYRKRKWGILATKVVPAYIAASNHRNEQGFEPIRIEKRRWQSGSVRLHREGLNPGVGSGG